MESISGNYYMKSSPQNIIWYWNSGESKKRYIETKYKIVIIIGEEIKKVETHKPKLSKKKNDSNPDLYQIENILIKPLQN